MKRFSRKITLLPKDRPECLYERNLVVTECDCCSRVSIPLLAVEYCQMRNLYESIDLPDRKTIELLWHDRFKTCCYLFAISRGAVLTY